MSFGEKYASQDQTSFFSQTTSIFEIVCFTFAVIQAIVITTVYFKCAAGPSIISKDRNWAIIKKRLPTTGLGSKVTGAGGCNSYLEEGKDIMTLL